MNFWIQSSNPCWLQLKDKMANDLSEAIEAVFPMETEDALLVWNNIYIPLNYKYDLGTIIDDLLFMLSDLLESKEGCHEVSFGSSTFNTQWSLVWANGNLSISAKWNSIVGDLNMLTSTCDKLEITVDDFLREWKSLLRKIITAIETSGIVVEDRENYELMIKVDSALDHYGRLYQKVT